MFNKEIEFIFKKKITIFKINNFLETKNNNLKKKYISCSIKNLC